MSKVTQIERALQSLDPASFQRLCDAYLKKRGNDHINPVGLTVGADKVAIGTPDTLIMRADGNYDFAEYSTQQEGLAEKFAKDIAKCLDEAKTGVPLGRIHRIILCHNARLSTGEEFELTEQCRLQGVMLSIYGPGPIAHDLCEKYRGLARDHLGISVDTGQIVTADEFITSYSKRGFATPLDTIFKFREEQLKQVQEGLTENDLVLVSGRPGVGKTRFALECCERYAVENPDVEIRCIFNKGVDLFEDFRVHFSEPGHFLIFVDDANRVSRFEYAVQLLNDLRTDQKLKIIATVRDYALDSAHKAARFTTNALTIELDRFKDDQISQLVRDNSSITNQFYLERITDIAQGNPRLAIMATRIAERENDLRSIADVSALYDEYFQSVRNDLDELGNPALILTAGIIAFFRVIDRSNAEIMGAITDSFHIDPEEFWNAALRLHELEVVDMYEKEIVRISDQVLSTYLFYLAAFRDRALDFGILLERFFPDFRYRVIDALNPVLSAFDSQAILNELRRHVDLACELRTERGDEDGLTLLLDTFWFVKPTDTLLYLQKKIDVLPIEPKAVTDLSFAKSTGLPPSPSILGILNNFGSGDEASVKAAIALILDYLEKRPAEVPLVIRALEEHYGIDRYSYLNGFVVERAVIDAVWSRTDSGKNELFCRLFLTIAEPLLHTHFQTSESRSHRSIAIISFDVPASDSFLELRRTIWQRLFSLYSSPMLRQEVLKVIGNHSRSGYLVDDTQIIKSDSDQLFDFFESSLDSASYSHCVIVQDYLDMLERLGVGIRLGLRAQFTNDTYELSELVLVDRRERRELGWQEHQELHRQRLDAYTEKFDASKYGQFFDRCHEIIRNTDGGQYEYQVRMSVVDLLFSLADRNPSLFVSVLQQYLATGNALQLGPWGLVAKLIEVCGSDEAYEIINSRNYPGRVSWLFGYFSYLPQEDVTATRLRELYLLYDSAMSGEIPTSWDHLLKFLTIDKDVIVNVTRTLVKRSATDQKFGAVLSGLFTDRSEVGPKIRELFCAEVDLLKKAYFAGSEAHDHEDFDGAFFNTLLDLDPNFGREWVAQLYERIDRPSRHDDSRNYAFIWRRLDFISVMEQIVDAVVVCGKKRLIYDPYLLNFFALVDGTPDLKDLHKHQDEFLDQVISRRHREKDLMAILFEVISSFGPERRRARFTTFLSYSKDYEMFARLPMESSMAVYMGSAVPRLQSKLEFFQSLLPMLDTVELLRHRQYIEQRIQRTRDSIEAEKRRDFMTDGD